MMYILYLVVSIIAISPFGHATNGCNGANFGFTDVNGCDLYYGAIEWMHTQSIVEGEFGTNQYGKSGQMFYPTRPINRAEFTKLVLLSTVDEANITPCIADPFPDVPKNAWFAPYICAAKQNGIISGFPDGTFKPALHISYASSAKILANTFGAHVDASNVTYYDNVPLWYKPYVLALTTQKAVAPTISSFDHRVTRGEMAEMIYRLVHKKPSYTYSPEYMELANGFGYNTSFGLEFLLGLWFNAPEFPFFLTPATTDLWGTMPNLQGYKLFHTVDSEIRCSESGLWEHCSPNFVDWSISLFITDQSIKSAMHSLLLKDAKTLYFGGMPGLCSTHGVEGEHRQFCFVPLPDARTLIIERTFIVTDVAYMDLPGITPITTQDAWFARLRKSLRIIE